MEPIKRPIKRPGNPSQRAPPTTQIKAATGGMELRPNVASQGLRMLSTIPTKAPKMRRIRAEDESPFKKAMREKTKATGEAPITGINERMSVIKKTRKNSPKLKSETPVATSTD